MAGLKMDGWVSERAVDRVSVGSAGVPLTGRAHWVKSKIIFSIIL